MNQIKTGGPAFPLPRHTRKWDEAKKDYVQDEGMTLRDYFAAKAMQGQLSRPNAAYLGEEEVAKVAYMQADAMLKAREA
jgi:hypothetical protein